MATVLLDSSGTLALLDRNDPQHLSALASRDRLASDGDSVFLTNFVRAETHALLGIRLSWDIARRWLMQLDLPVESVLPADEARAIEIVVSRADKTYSLVDATSFAVMERLGIRRAFTLDRHFRQHGFETVP